MSKEIWKDVVGYERVYQVSSRGRVKRVAGGRGAVIQLYATGKHTQTELGKLFDVSQASIWRIVRRETWKHVP